jgi:hypothetical protein
MGKGFVPKVRTRALDFKGTEYEGLEVTVYTSFPMGLYAEFQSGEMDRMMVALSQIIQSWNLCDYKTGEPLGAPTPQALALAPQDILVSIIGQAISIVSGGNLHPNAVAPSANS